MATIHVLEPKPAAARWMWFQETPVHCSSSQCLGRDLPHGIPEMPGVDVAVNLCLAPRNGFMEQIPQRASVPQVGVFHTPRLRNTKVGQVLNDLGDCKARHRHLG